MLLVDLQPITNEHDELRGVVLVNHYGGLVKIRLLQACG